MKHTKKTTTKDVIGLYGRFIMNTYTRSALCLDEAKGAVVRDIDGRKYLDFFPGWAVSGIGHCHPKVTANVARQVKRLIHVSNNFYSLPQALLAQKIVKSAFPGKVFFCNSGAEANEAAVKLARKYGHATARYEVITMLQSFHGRTLAMISATGQDKVKKGFEPLPEGFRHVPFNDLEALKEAISEKTIAVMMEPIQCEGGIRVARKEYLQAVRKMCDEKDIVLILDEVQTGMGRTGRLYCYQQYGIAPDIMTLAKSLGGGLPIGVMVANARFADILTPGTHASTFGGSPIVCAAALGVFEAIEKEGLLENARAMGDMLFKKLAALKKKFAFIKETRGMALTIGVELDREADDIVTRCRERGLLINCTQKKVLRIMPPLTVTKQEIEKAISILERVFSEI